jgi:hypothetical protein
VIYELVVSASTAPNNVVFQQRSHTPFMGMNVGDYFSFGDPNAPPTASNNGFIMKMRHALYRQQNEDVCSVWVLINAAS